MKALARSSSSLFAFVFIYTALHCIHLHFLLPANIENADPYEVSNQGDTEADSRAVINWEAIRFLKSDGVQPKAAWAELPSLAFASGQDLPPAHSLTLSGSATFSAWLKPEMQLPLQCIASLDQRWMLALKHGAVFISSARSGGHTTFTTFLTAPLHNWTHVAVSLHPQNGSVSVYINGTSAPVLAELLAVRQPTCILYLSSITLTNAHFLQGNFSDASTNAAKQLQLATCDRYKAGVGSHWVGWLAGVHVLDRALSPGEAQQLQLNSHLSDTIYSLPSSAIKQLNFSQVPSQPARASIVQQMSPSRACALPSPNSIIVLGIPKPPSLTAMAWIQMADAPRIKEACIMSHGSWEKGWKLSM
jgi:hypothetical protein